MTTSQSDATEKQVENVIDAAERKNLLIEKSTELEKLLDELKILTRCIPEKDTPKAVGVRNDLTVLLIRTHSMCKHLREL